MEVYLATYPSLTLTIYLPLGLNVYRIPTTLLAAPYPYFN
jgi:hypothetical protein